MPTVPGEYWHRSPAGAPTPVRIRHDEFGSVSVDYLEDGETEQAFVPGLGDEWATA